MVLVDGTQEANDGDVLSENLVNPRVSPCLKRWLKRVVTFCCARWMREVFGKVGFEAIMGVVVWLAVVASELIGPWREAMDPVS